jgi:hypothetical protein
MVVERSHHVLAIWAAIQDRRARQLPHGRVPPARGSHNNVMVDDALQRVTRRLEDHFRVPPGSPLSPPSRRTPRINERPDGGSRRPGASEQRHLAGSPACPMP